MTEVFGIQIELFLGILTGLGVPGCAAAFFVIRHFWEKTKCFHLMKQKIEQLDKIATGSHDTHTDLYNKIDRLERNLFLLMGKMKVTPVD
ncbi:hypothetical protein LCGC14_0380950 [marine sediment metagenome]|uniref:Uncharacterized protein n=1 Tax=marine sediment metagenome TaxID=412755 RepID=A0A0F9T8G3_9ZZZZ